MKAKLKTSLDDDRTDRIDDNFINKNEHIYIGSDFWKSQSLEALAKAQNVKAIVDVNTLFGTWPGEPDDGFEDLIDKLRHIL
ncbi:MAG: hypothetical protein HQK63_11075 [Desulfamplus sp.]|nr:hypothetical protein [Desulfamplus sp.]